MIVPTVGTEKENCMNKVFNIIVVTDDGSLVEGIRQYYPYIDEQYVIHTAEDLESVVLFFDASCVNAIIIDYEYLTSSINIYEFFQVIDMLSESYKIYLINLTDNEIFCNSTSNEHIGMDLILPKSKANYVVENIRMLDFATNVLSVPTGGTKVEQNFRRKRK